MRPPRRDFGPSEQPFDDIGVLSFTHAVAGPTVGRTLAEHGADVFGATRPIDYEHEHIYAEANVVVNNHRLGSLKRRGLILES